MIFFCPVRYAERNTAFRKRPEKLCLKPAAQGRAQLSHVAAVGRECGDKMNEYRVPRTDPNGAYVIPGTDPLAYGLGNV
jgi:hypothetical protein